MGLLNLSLKDLILKKRIKELLYTLSGKYLKEGLVEGKHKNNLEITNLISNIYSSTSWFSGKKLNKKLDFKARVYIIENDINDLTCRCGEELSFKSGLCGFNKHCSLSCSKLDPIVQELGKQTSLERYGTEFAQQSDQVKKTVKQNHLLKYGVTNPFKLEEFKDKYKQTCLKRFGTTNPTNRHINDLKNLYNKDFIIDNFLKENIFDNLKFSKHFGCQLHYGYKILDELKISYTREYKIKSEEIYILNFLKSEFENIKYSIQNRKEINPFELDIYLPEYNLAIEFNGLYWHSFSVNNNKNISKHQSNYYYQKFHKLKKSILCLEKGIRLIHIDENTL